MVAVNDVVFIRGWIYGSHPLRILFFAVRDYRLSSAYCFIFGHFMLLKLDLKFWPSYFQLLMNQLEPLTEQQSLAINNLQESSQQAEDALSQGMEALQQSLAETLAGSLSPSSSSGNVANYMGQMAMAMGKLGTLEGFIRQVIFTQFDINVYSFGGRLRVSST